MGVTENHISEKKLAMYVTWDNSKLGRRRAPNVSVLALALVQTGVILAPRNIAHSFPRRW